MKLQPNLINKRNFERKYYNLIDDQTKLGWKQIYYGRFTYEWISLQETHLLLNRDKETNLNWISGALVEIWTHLHRRWRLRCDTATETRNQEETISTEHIKEEAAYLYALSDQIPVHARDIFKPSIDQLLRKPPHIIKQWITCNKTYILSLIPDDSDTSTTHSQTESQHEPVEQPEDNTPTQDTISNDTSPSHHQNLTIPIRAYPRRLG